MLNRAINGLLKRRQTRVHSLKNVIRVTSTANMELGIAIVTVRTPRGFIMKRVGP